jgi:hypothetical protein
MGMVEALEKHVHGDSKFLPSRREALFLVASNPGNGNLLLSRF